MLSGTSCGSNDVGEDRCVESNERSGEDRCACGIDHPALVFGFFVVVAAVFHLRARKVDGPKGAVMAFNWQRYLVMFYTVSGLITVRNVSRVAEHAMGGM